LYQLSTDIEGSAEVCFQLGTLLNNLDRLKDSRDQLQRALDMTQSTNDKPQRIKTLLQLSSVSYSEGDNPGAERLANTALELARTEGLDNLTVNCLIDIGNIFFWRGKYNEATQYFNQALQNARTNKGRRGEAKALLSLGSLSLQEADSVAALNF